MKDKLNKLGKNAKIASQKLRLLDVLNKSKVSWGNIVFVRIYLVNFQDFDKVNRVYETYFTKDKLPARTCIGVTGLAVGSLIEIDLIAKI